MPVPPEEQPEAQPWVTRTGPTPDADTSAPETVHPGPAAEQTRPVVVPGYEVLEELGRGGMGVVYKARQKGLNRLVALKMILSGAHASRQDLARFRAEAEAVARLQHPNIVQVYEINEGDGRPFFSMEFVGGGSLANRLGGRPRTPRDAALLVRALALAVHAAHQEGIIHRDLKPANILLGQERRGNSRAGQPAPDDSIRQAQPDPQAALTDCVPKITDFGLAKQFTDEGASGPTRDGDILGTPSYMAPEQASGKLGVIGPATDIHALGAILYEMLTGRPPFGKADLMETLEQVRKEDATPVRRLNVNVPRDLEIICLKCLRKEPARRYVSALELADDLRRFLDHEPIRARPASMWERFVKSVRRRPVLTTAVVCLLLLGPLVYLVERLRRPAPVEELPEHDQAAIRRAAARARRPLYELLQKGRTPDGWIKVDPRSPDSIDVEVWTQAQASLALLSMPDLSPAELRQAAAHLEVVFTRARRIERNGVRYGWSHLKATQTEAEPALWTAAALAAALRPGLLPGGTRRRFEGHLDETHAILRTYEPANPQEGWHIVPHPRNRSVANTYTNVLALLALLETKKAGLGWGGSAQRRDRLIEQTAGWLVRHFDA